MDVIPDFPEHRNNDPKRQAELAIYRELAGSEAAGAVIYESRPYPHCPELDFVILLETIGRYATQVKGGPYRVDRGTLYLQLPDGTERQVGSILKECWDATMALHRWLQERIPDGRSPFMVPVVIFPDMEPDEAIEAWAVQANVRVIWGSDNLVERLIEMARTCRFFYPPTAEEVQEEVRLILGAAAPEHEEQQEPEHQQRELDRDRHEPREGEARHVNIHIDVLNLYLR